ncbi:YdcF family protein [Amnibacterium kyonggiense]
MTSETTTRRGTRLRVGGFVALGGLIVWILAGLPFFVFPTTDPVPQHADVVLVLGPPVPDRIAVAERLLAEHRVATALVSVPGEEAQWQVEGLCARSDVICFRPDPSTTRGEARELRAEAAAHAWTSAVVTTMPAHIARARTIVGRCFGGKLSMVADAEGPYDGYVYQYLYQTAATVKSWILQGC